MLLVDLFFYLFATLLLVCGAVVVTARNPVHAVFFLILAFFNAAGLFVLLGAEFLAMLLIVVYVGAVAVLFLFVVMMLDVDFAELKAGFVGYFPVGALVGVVLVAEVSLMLGGFASGELKLGDVVTGGEISNLEQIGRVLYTDYVFAFEIAGAILLVAMIGAIVLTQYQRPDVERQDINKQVNRSRADSVENKSVKSGEGI